MPLYLKDKYYSELKVEKILQDCSKGEGVDVKETLYNVAQLSGSLLAKSKMGMYMVLHIMNIVNILSTKGVSI